MSVKQRFLFCFLCMFAGVTVLPVLFACFFGVPSADDFTNTIPFLSYERNVFHFVFDRIRQIYLEQQGTYTGNVIVSIPVYYLFGLNVLRLEMVLAALFFFGSLFFCSWTVARVLGAERADRVNFSLLLLFCTVFYVVNFVDVQELFFWHTGLAMYTVPLSFLFITLSMWFSLDFVRNKKLCLATGMISAVMAAGGSLDVSALLCSILLFLVCYDVFIAHRVRATIAIGLVALAGSVMNALAPGNFVRHGIIDSEIDVLRSVLVSFRRLNNVLLNDFQAGTLLSLFAVTFAFSFHILKSTSLPFRYPGLVTFFSYLSCVITDFPVMLGYSSRDWEFMHLRCVCVERLAIVLYVLLLAVYWGGWTAKKRFPVFTKEFFMGLSFVCIVPLSAFLPIVGRSKPLSITMLYHELKGDYLREARRQEKIIFDIEQSDDGDVVVSVERLKSGEWSNIKVLGLSENKDFWINKDVARYFGKRSVAFDYSD